MRTKEKTKKKSYQTITKIKISFPDNCPHKPFFGCKNPNDCLGCYYNPEKKIALMKRELEDPVKTVKENWFYGNKKHAKICLDMLDDIKHGRGLHKGGNRCFFKYARKSEDE